MIVNFKYTTIDFYIPILVRARCTFSRGSQQSKGPDVLGRAVCSDLGNSSSKSSEGRAVLSCASGFVVGSYDIFSQVDIALCTLETIAEGGFVFCFNRMI